MFKRILEFFFGKKETAVEPSVPYKVEPPAENVVFVDRGTVVSIPMPVVVDASLDTKPTVAEAPAKKTRKPRANVAAKKIADAKKPSAKKPAAPRKPKAPAAE